MSVPSLAPVSAARLLSSSRGGLLGQAVGDALGSPTEGHTRPGIAEYFGYIHTHVVQPSFQSLGWDRPWQQNRDPLLYTDDTILALALTDTLVEARGYDDLRFTEHQLALYDAETDIWLIRGAGATERSFVKGVTAGVPRHLAGTVSEGCGAAMRVAPVGIYYAHDLGTLRHAAVRQALLTHRTPYAAASAYAVALAVALATRGMPPGVACLREIADRTRPVCLEFSEAMEALIEAFERHASQPEVGYPWGLPTSSFGPNVVLAALATYTAFGTDFRRCIVEAATFGGDNDSSAAMAGAMCGAYLGVAAIPEDLSAIRFRDQILIRGRALAGDRSAITQRRPLVEMEREIREETLRRRAAMELENRPAVERQAAALEAAGISNKRCKRLLIDLQTFELDGRGRSAVDWLLASDDADPTILHSVFGLVWRKRGVSPSTARRFLGHAARDVRRQNRPAWRATAWHAAGRLLDRHLPERLDTGFEVYWDRNWCILPTGVEVTAAGTVEAVLQGIHIEIGSDETTPTRWHAATMSLLPEPVDAARVLSWDLVRLGSDTTCTHWRWDLRLEVSLRGSSAETTAHALMTMDHQAGTVTFAHP